MEIGFYYGILSEKLSKQMYEKKLKFDKEVVKHFEKELDAIHTLRFGSVNLNDSISNKLIAKLHKEVIKHVAKANKMSVNKPSQKKH